MIGLKKRDIKKALKAGAKAGGMSLADVRENIEATIDEATLLFLGEQFKMFEVLEFITEHKILISKIERVEPSLESLFMEVVSK